MFVKLTGRYDLVVDTTDWADNGADYFIQAGQNMIESLVGDLPESEGRIWETISSGEHFVNFQQRCRMILQVWANDSENRIELVKKSWTELKEIYTSILADTDSGSPLYYCPAKLREISTTGKNGTGVFFNNSLAISTDFRGIVIMPPVDEDHDIEIFGKFYQPVLAADDQENYWTITHPNILIKAATYQNELFYRNRQALKTLYDSVMLDLSEIDKDAVEESMSGVNQIKG